MTRLIPTGYRRSTVCPCEKKVGFLPLVSFPTPENTSFPENPVGRTTSRRHDGPIPTGKVHYS